MKISKEHDAMIDKYFLLDCSKEIFRKHSVLLQQRSKTQAPQQEKHVMFASYLNVCIVSLFIAV